MSSIVHYFVSIGRGAILTVVVTVVVMALSLVLGMLLAVARMQSRSRALSRVVGACIEFLRATPMLVQLMWLYYVLPSVTPIRLSGLLTGVLSLTLWNAAFNAETFRAGLGSLPQGQREAALAMGMTPVQAFRRVLMPQAVRRVLPPLGTTWVQLFQNTSILAFIQVSELTFKSLSLSEETYEYLPIFTALFFWYLFLGYPQAKAVDWLHRRLQTR
jgi:His/Glu/Gln/Arg/opine family amino acid ABC transporter permease subunit